MGPSRVTRACTTKPDKRNHGQTAVLDLLELHRWAVHANRVEGELVDKAGLHSELGVVSQCVRTGSERSRSTPDATLSMRSFNKIAASLPI